MAFRFFRRFVADQSGAVAATYAIAIPALVAIAGVGMDYGRMVALDTELQNAADQASLAGATQLDGSGGSMERAIAAAQGGLVRNFTRMGNDGDTPTIDVPQTTIVFYQTRADAEAKVNGFTDVTRFEDAHFVELSVETRGARYALTPLVGAFGAVLSAQATAGIGSAICKTPPVMMCNPAEPLGNTNPDLDFDANGLVGAGVLLIAGDADAPGNFGFLDTNIGQGNSTPELAQNLGYNTPPGECQPTSGVDLKTGARDVVLNALNTRFDIFANGMNTCPGGGTCSSSRNARKDLVRGTSCGLGSGQNWQVSANPYVDRALDGAELPTDGSRDPDIMGHPRDICHARATESASGVFCDDDNGGYNGRIGNKLWDRNAYFRVNYGWNNATWKSNTGLTDLATRYDVYKWELLNTAQSDKVQATGSNPVRTGYSAPVCSAGVAPGPTTIDRRRISVAVLNCEALGLNGAETNQPVLKWVDLFLVEPAVVRKRGNAAVTGARDVYVEILGETDVGRYGSTVGQVVRRDVPYLVR